MKRTNRNYSNLRNYSNPDKLVKIIKFDLSFLIKVKLHTIYHVLTLHVSDITLEFCFLRLRISVRFREYSIFIMKYS